MEKVKLSTNSWHRWIYNHVYGSWDRLPNLCPYFWKFLGGLFVVILMIPFILPYAIFKLVDQRKWPHYKEDFGAILGMWLVTLTVICMVGMWWQKWDKSNITFAQTVGIIGYTLLFIALLVVGVQEIKDRRDRRRIVSDYYSRPEKVKTKWFLVEFAKAWYYKHCPAIEWE